MNMCLREKLFENREKNWFFVEPGGNYGDQLIYDGAYKLADEIGCRYEKYDFNRFMSKKPGQDEFIYIHGVGGYNSYNSGTPFDILERASSARNSTVIQGPCTVDPSEKTLDRINRIVDAGTHKELSFFAREYKTYNSISNSFKTKNAFIYHDNDTAFHLDKAHLEKLYGKVRSIYDLDVIRIDTEAVSLNPRRQSAIRLDPAFYANSYEHWIKIHSQAKSALSNRTHSAILAAILGKPVIFFGGIYHKNRSIWEYSLKDRGVKWLNEADEQYFQDERTVMKLLPSRIKNSYKVIRVINSVKGLPSG
ncbi:MAG: hypothetical protein CSB48_10225 [Proteobacteria bacterium]|nr:MAG: hypothetical protein CSB48_10225 [Pseudomonadota bacterium]